MPCRTMNVDGVKVIACSRGPLTAGELEAVQAVVRAAKLKLARENPNADLTLEIDLGGEA